MNAKVKTETGSDYEGLPQVLARVAEALGPEIAARLVERCGGTRVYVASNPGPGNRLVKAVGLEAARAIERLFGRGQLLIPIGPASEFNPRTSVPAIRRLIAEGRSNGEIACMVRCHYDTVRRIRSGARHRRYDLEAFLGRQ